MDLYHRLAPDEVEKIRALYGKHAFAASKIQSACELLERLVTARNFPEFLTFLAYDELE